MKSNTIERARHYAAKMPVSISGQGGHSAAFKAACAAAVGFDLTDDEALSVLADWNAACQPPWSERELRHKIASARKSCKYSPGYLLRDIEGPRWPVAVGFEDESAHKARRRRAWPSFHPLHRAEIEAIAALRRLPASAVLSASLPGFFRSARVDGQPCFIIRENLFAQARRCDGLPFTLADGRQIKAKNLPGATGAFIGVQWLGAPEVRVLLVEGAIGLVEAIAAHDLSETSKAWTILAATSASSRFSTCPGLLQQLAGRRVRILPDRDEAGLEAAATWLADLESVGCQVDAPALPDGIKDLGPIVAAADAHKETLHRLFQ